MKFRQIADDRLAQYAYLVGCQRTKEALLVDPERDVDRYLELARRENLRIVAVTETHIHADFVSGARELVSRDPSIRLLLSGEGGEAWSYRWPDADGRTWTALHDGDTFRVGNVELVALHTPGHTPEHLAFLIVDRGAGADQPMALLSGDFVFVGDLGRPDLLESAAGIAGMMEPSARSLFASARRFLELDDYLQVWPGHGAGSACGKALGAVPTTTVGYERRFSPALAAVGRGERPFVNFILEGQPEPPLYFARMKRWNRDGPPVLGELPRPARLAADELARFGKGPRRVVVDTRPDRQGFFARHVRGSFYAPLDRAFPTIAGSYLEPEQELALVVAEERLDEVVRELIRVGLDRVAAWAPPDAIAELPTEAVSSIPSIDFGELAGRLDGGAALDVRGASEVAAGHLPAALTIPHTRLAARADELPRDRRIFVHCASGERSAPASSWLAARGFDVVHVDGRYRPVGGTDEKNRRP
jgi:hydroxyacylglutathione hydrolase